jgi:hypothetical protein
MDEQPTDEVPSNTGLYVLGLTSIAIVLVWFLASNWVS